MPLFDTLTLKKNRPRADMKPNDFRKMILQKGFEVKWEQAAICPCQRQLNLSSKVSLTGESRQNCPKCSGTGVIYHSPLNIKAWVGGVRNEHDLLRQYGEYGPGTIFLSLLPEHTPGALDKFTLLSNLIVFRETRTKGSGAIERMRYPIIKRSVSIGSQADSDVAETLTVGAIYIHKAAATGIVGDPPITVDQDFSTFASNAGSAKLTVNNVSNWSGRTLIFHDRTGRRFKATVDTSVTAANSTATKIGFSGVTTTTHAATSIKNSIDQAAAYGITASTKDTADGSGLLGVSTTTSTNTVTITQSSTGYVDEPSFNGTLVSGELQEGLDFQIRNDGQIDWTLGVSAGTAPTNGEFYSVTYYTHPTYVVDSIPHTFRDATTRIKTNQDTLSVYPTQVMCKLEYLLNREADGSVV